MNHVYCTLDMAILGGYIYRFQEPTLLYVYRSKGSKNYRMSIKGGDKANFLVSFSANKKANANR